MSNLTHINAQGDAHMVDVSAKPHTLRIAVACGHISMKVETLAAIVNGTNAKGDVLATARIAGIMAAKRCAELIPLCHSLPISAVEIDIEPNAHGLEVRARVITAAQTGVEMEALTAVSLTLLTLYDMTKALDKSMVMGEVRLLSKTGGKSGDWVRP
jgi:cyclic pyranopterin monophosphate synthase